jgi:hypothetical protein
MSYVICGLHRSETTFVGEILKRAGVTIINAAAYTAENIAQLLPKVKFIAVLRDPVERHISHYCMCVGMGLKKRNINQAILDCLLSPSPKGKENTETNSYVLWSQYGKIFKEYNKVFVDLSENLLIVGFDELVQDQ